MAAKPHAYVLGSKSPTCALRLCRLALPLAWAFPRYVFGLGAACLNRHAMHALAARCSVYEILALGHDSLRHRWVGSFLQAVFNMHSDSHLSLQWYDAGEVAIKSSPLNFGECEWFWNGHIISNTV